MTKDEAKQLPSAKKPHWLMSTLPPYLKDPANYEKIQRAILDAGATGHSHSEIVDWAGCMHCQMKEKDRLVMMKKLGFQNAAQYLGWRKIHEKIIERYPLAKYNAK